MGGLRRVGYFISLTIMILSIFAVPLGVIVSIGGFFDSLDSGNTATFGGGVAMIAIGIIGFFLGLVLSIILKKSGNDKQVIIVDKSESKTQLKINNPKIVELPTNEQPKLEEPMDEDVSLQDMINDLKEMGRGDTPRLKYIEKRIIDNRVIYNSDLQYVKKQFKILRAEITKDDDV